MSQKKASLSCMSIHEYERMIAIAFQADVENFLMQFESLKSLSFNDFSNVWRKMMFSYVNSKQQYFTFIQHFMENAFFVLKKFIVFARSIYVEVGALYLLYAMYFKQTVDEWVKIRITSEEYVVLQDLLQKLKIKKELEPLFVYNKLLNANAFEYVFQRKAIAPEQRYLRNCTEFVDDIFQSNNARNAIKELSDVLKEGDFLENYTRTMGSYKQALSNIAASNPGLGSFSSTLLTDLNSLLKSSPSALSEDNNEDSD